MRRRWTVVARIGLVVLVMGALSGCDWTMLRGGPAHTGSTPGETVIGIGNVAALTPRPVAIPASIPTDGEPVVVGDLLYVTGSGGLGAFDTRGRTCSGSPTTCDPLVTFASAAGTPAIADGTLVARSTDAQGLAAVAGYDATGASCPGTPATCAPRWKATVGITTGAITIADGRVFVAANAGTQGLRLYAFDLSGHPLWTADGVFGPVAVAGGTAFVTASDGRLYAFDAAGGAGCSGVPRTCRPLWTSTPLLGAPITSGTRSAAVDGGTVYVGTGSGTVAAFDAAGGNGCAGVPRVCNPLWTTSSGSGGSVWSPAVATGVLYAVGTGNALSAFDARGATNCSGTPKVCRPLWSVAGAFGAPAVANGVVYVPTPDRRLLAVDAAGRQGCTGSPTTCAPLATFTSPGGLVGQPAVANGRLYAAWDVSCTSIPCPTPSRVLAYSP